MSLTEKEREILKLAAQRLRKQEEELESLEKEAEKTQLVDDIMNILEKKGCLSTYSEQEKRAKLENMDVNELKSTKNTVENFLQKNQIKIGEVDENNAKEELDPISSWLVYDV